jgi:hypothetical protein
MENIEHLTEQDLVDLQAKINHRLERIKAEKLDELNRKNSVKDKIKLSQLTSQDRILGIRLAWDNTKDGKYLKALNAKWSVDLVDYCNVKGFESKSSRKSEWNRISISHKGEPFGISTSIDDEEADKPYLLFLDTSPTGYDGFFTLSPATWKEDIQTAFKFLLKQRKYYQDLDTKKLKDKIKLVIGSEEKINNFINKL